MLFQSSTNGIGAIQGVLDAQTVRHLVEHGVAKEGVKRDMLTLIFRNEHFGNRNEDLVEFGLHRVLQLQASRAFGQLNLFVVGQVDGDRLRARIRIASVINGIVGVQIRVRTRGFGLVRVRDGQSFLKHR